MKRLFDLIIAVTSSVALAPLVFLIALLIYIKHGSPIFFCQMRPGEGGAPFKLYKFSTMTGDTDEYGNFLSDNKRITSFGKILRSTSLDELPEIINVLKGEMSLVGPRPLLMQYLDRYTTEQARRHDVKPGITGWAQVNGRNDIGWEEKFKLDVWYVDNWSIWLDIKILIMTLKKVVMREGISKKGYATTDYFMGEENE